MEEVAAPTEHLCHKSGRNVSGNYTMYTKPYTNKDTPKVVIEVLQCCKTRGFLPFSVPKDDVVLLILEGTISSSLCFEGSLVLYVILLRMAL